LILKGLMVGGVGPNRHKRRNLLPNCYQNFTTSASGFRGLHRGGPALFCLSWGGHIRQPELPFSGPRAEERCLVAEIAEIRSRVSHNETAVGSDDLVQSLIGETSFFSGLWR
jgi:hypothetical protein